MLKLVICLLVVTLVCSGPTKERKKRQERDLNQVIRTLGHQLLMQQLYIEEKIRGDGYSGVKQMYVQSEDGTRPYFHPHHNGPDSVLGMTQLPTTSNTAKYAAFTAVLNGVEFRTKQNTYQLLQPHSTSGDFQATEEVTYPDVPPSVTQQATVGQQVDEMKEYFRAFRDQNPDHRDYTPYFKPVLCYLEGTWTQSEGAYDLESHYNEVATWFTQTQNTRFSANLGKQPPDNIDEYLPTRLFEMVDGTKPRLARWNYRILCQPVKDVPTNAFRLVDDLATRFSKKYEWDKYATKNNARFELHRSDDIMPHAETYGLLDELMAQVPGLDNQKGNIKDDATGDMAYDYLNKDQELNAAFYHRYYSEKVEDRLGNTTRKRGFSDRNLFVALNTQARVAGQPFPGGAEQKVSYAIPLDITYLTPLPNWNPYGIQYKGDADSTEGQTVTAGGRNGGSSDDKAYDGTNSELYYQTPDEFFAGGTAKGVLGEDNAAHQVQATGLRIRVNVAGLGNVRLRYPIMPVHGEGSAAWKELEALKDVVMEAQHYGHLLRERIYWQ